MNSTTPASLRSIRKTKTLCVDLRWIDASGVGIYIQGIMPGIIEGLRDVSIVCIGDRSRMKEFPWAYADNVQLIDCHAKRYSLGEQVQLPLTIPRQTDLFFSPYYTIPLLYSGRFAVTVHDMSHAVVPEIIGDRRKRLYAQLMYHEVRRRASAIFTVSEFSKKEFLRLTQGSRESNVYPTPLGVSPEWHRASELPQVGSGRYFVCVGNVKPYKNLQRLVNAFLSIKSSIQQDLVIIGQSKGLITGESADFFRKVEENKDRIHLTGYVSFQELLSLVGHASALIMPSLYEGFGLPPLEAMAAGTPTVVSQAASLPEVCGNAALYFDPLDEKDIAEKLVLIASNAALAARLRDEGRRRSKGFTWDSCARLTTEHLRECLCAQP
jgi:glycosyltransferase involved in cell wall biosynthesis